MTVVDHCHFTYSFLGYAHHDCNLARRTPNFTPVIAHNLSNYDMHAIVTALCNAKMNNQFSVVPSTEKKYMSLTISVWIKEIEDKHGEKKQIDENLRFIDSYKFMLSSLSQLIKKLAFVYNDKRKYLKIIEKLTNYTDKRKYFNLVGQTIFLSEAADT